MIQTYGYNSSIWMKPPILLLCSLCIQNEKKSTPECQRGRAIRASGLAMKFELRGLVMNVFEFLVLNFQHTKKKVTSWPWWPTHINHFGGALLWGLLHYIRLIIFKASRWLDKEWLGFMVKYDQGRITAWCYYVHKRDRRQVRPERERGT